MIDWRTAQIGSGSARGLQPPHWKEGKGATWDAGYEATGFFLEWVERRYGAGSVRELNARLAGRAYDERVFKDLTGRRVGKLWEMYRASLDGGDGVKDGAGGEREASASSSSTEELVRKAGKLLKSISFA